MASSKIKGITIEIGGETTKLGQALEGVEKQSSSLQRELRGVESLLKLDPSNVDLLRQKQELLTQTISATEDKLKTLNSTMDQIKSGEIQVTEEQFRDLQREIVSTEQKLERLREETKSFGSVFQQQVEVAAGKVKDLGGKVEEAGKKMGALSAAASAGLVASTKSAADNEAAINKYIASTGKATSETEKYKELMETIYQNNYGDSIADVADKMRIVSNLLGDLPDTELQKVVEKSYMLQNAYDMDFQENIRGVKSLMEQFGITADQAYELINQGAQKGLNQNQDLTDQIAEYSVYYRQLGFTADEFFNVMVNGAQTGAYQIDYMNDAMKEFGIRAIDGSESTKQAFKDLGLNAESTMKKFASGGEDAQEAFNDVIIALNGVDDQVKYNEIGVALFGTKWEDLGSETVYAMTDAAQAIKSTGNTVEETAETMYGGTSAKAQKAVRSIQTAFAELGEVILPIIAPIVEKIAEIAKKFSELNPTVKKIIVVVLGVVAAAAPLLIIIGKVITAVGVIMPIITKIGAVLAKAPVVLGAIKGAIAAVVGVLGWPVTIIMAIIGVIVLLWTKCEWFRDGVMAVIDAIKNGLQAAYDWLMGVFTSIAEFFVNAVQWLYDNVIAPIVEFFKGLWNGIVEIFTPAIQWFAQLFTSVWESIKSILEVIVGLFKGTWELIKAVWGVVAQWFNDTVIQPIKNFFTPIVQWFKDLFQQAWEGIKTIWSAVSSWFNEKIIQPVSNFFTGMWNKLKTGASNAWEGIKSVFSSVTNWFRDQFTKAWTAVKNVFSTGGKIFDGIKDGIASVFKTVVNGIIGGINKVIAVPFNAINGLLNKIRSVSVAGIEPFKSFIKYNALSVPQIPKLKVGTNFVPTDEMPAILHKGEQVIPAKYNPAIDNTHMKNAMFDALTDFTNIRSQGYSEIGTLTTLLNKYMPEIIDNMGRGVYLDGRALVGQLTPQIDTQLGSLADRRRRGV